MKYEYTDGTHVDSNIDDEGTRMSISPEHVAHVINVLTEGLYSDNAMAAIRETATNADDAQRANGVTEPIRVFLPTEYSSVYEVIDRGEGMSAHTLRNEFGQYGWSSKRDGDNANDFNGMLGLGCKAPLAYTPQFTVVSVKGGLKNTAIIERGPDGVGRVRIPEELHDIPTDEEDGTTVQIPVIDVDTFSAKARDFFRFWDAGSVLVNGEAPESIWESKDVIALDEDVLLVPKAAVNHSDRVHLVMAGVTYPLDAEHSNRITRSLAYGTTVVTRVPTGSVNIPGNREALQYTSKTDDVLATLTDYVTEATDRRFRERITNCLTPSEAMDTAEEARSVLRSFDATWQGHAVPHRLRAASRARSGAGTIKADYGMDWRDSNNLWNVTANDLSTTSHNFPADSRVVVVTGYGNTSVSAINKAKVQHWIEAHGMTTADVRLVLFRASESRHLSVWIDGSDRLVLAPWAEVKKADLPDKVRKAAGYRSPSSSSSPSTAAPSDDLSEVREVRADGGYVVITRSDLMGRADVLMIAPSDKNKSERSELVVKAARIGITVIVVNKNRHDEALDQFRNVFTMDEYHARAEARMRARYERLPITEAAYKHEFAWREHGWGSGKEAASDLLRHSRRNEFFVTDHRVQSIKAIVDRLDRADKAMREINEFLRAVDSFYGYGDAVKPIYLLALKHWAGDQSNRTRKDMETLLKSKVDAFNDAYPLFQHIERNGDALEEYARLLSA